MLIRSQLFEKGVMTGQPGLSEVLANHERHILGKIRKISSLDEMTDLFLAKLVKDSIVEPLVLHFDQATHKSRTEWFDASEMPYDFFIFDRGGGNRYDKMV